MVSFVGKIIIVAISKNIHVGSKCYPERMSLIVLRGALKNELDLIFIS